MAGDGAYIRYVMQCKPVLLMRMDEPSGNAVDISGRGHSGTYDGSATRADRMHPLGRKVASASVTAIAAVSDSNDFTMSANGLTVIAWTWLVGSGAGDQFAVSKFAASNAEWGVSYQNATTSTPDPQANLYQSGGSNHAVATSVNPPIDPRGRWCMISLIAQPSTYLRVMVDDGIAFAQSTSFTGSNTNQSSDVEIGGPSGNRLNGSIGYVSIHPYALSHSDIATLFRLGMGRQRNAPRLLVA